MWENEQKVYHGTNILHKLKQINKKRKKKNSVATEKRNQVQVVENTKKKTLCQKKCKHCLHTSHTQYENKQTNKKKNRTKRGGKTRLQKKKTL